MRAVPHAVPFLTNKMPYSLLKTWGVGGGRGGCIVQNLLNLENQAEKNPQMCPFAELSCPFLVILHACPFKPATIKSQTVYSSLSKISLKLVLKSGKERI